MVWDTLMSLNWKLKDQRLWCLNVCLAHVGSPPLLPHPHGILAPQTIIKLFFFSIITHNIFQWVRIWMWISIWKKNNHMIRKLLMLICKVFQSFLINWRRHKKKGYSKSYNWKVGVGVLILSSPGIINDFFF